VPAPDIAGMTATEVVIDGRALTLADLRAVADGRARAVLAPAAWLRTRLSCSARSRSGGIATSESLPKPVVTP
jgi:hypothetical protein